HEEGGLVPIESAVPVFCGFGPGEDYLVVQSYEKVPAPESPIQARWAGRLPMDAFKESAFHCFEHPLFGLASWRSS
ncbi:MAG: hypothetical protein ABFR47_08920, partial [Verrucomicrobiota bacterium]